MIVRIPQSQAIKAFIFLTYLTAIGFVLTTQQENMEFCSQLKNIGPYVFINVSFEI